MPNQITCLNYNHRKGGVKDDVGRVEWLFGVYKEFGKC